MTLGHTTNLLDYWKLNTGRLLKMVNISTTAENTMSRHIFGHKVLVHAKMK